MKRNSTPLALLFIIALSGCQTARKNSDTGQAIPALTPEQAAQSAYLEGVHQLRERDFEKSEDAFLACIRFRPPLLKCRWELGWTYFSWRKWGKANEQWRAIQILQPKYPGLDDALEDIAKYIEIDLAARKLKLHAPTSVRAALRRKPAVLIRAGGDTMLGTDFPENRLPPIEEGNPLRRIEPLLRESDLSFVNHEGTLCDGGKSEKCEGSKSCFSFRSPTRFADFLKQAGINVVSAANNHIFDFGEDCRVSTEMAFQTRGIQWSGRPGSFASLEINGLKVALIAFHSAAHSNNTLETQKAQRLIRAVKKLHRLVIVSFHGGAEGFKALHVTRSPELYFKEPRGDVYHFAHAAIDAGAALVIGHGPHVARAMEFYKGHLIAYSLGNFSTYGSFNLSGFNSVGMLLEVGLDSRGKLTHARIIPTQQVGKGYVAPDPDATTVDLVRYLSKEDFPKSAPIIAKDGTLRARSSKK